MPRLKTLSDEARATLAASAIKECGSYWTLDLPAQLGRKPYEECKLAIVGAGGAWNRKSATHIFPSDPRPLLGVSIESGAIRNEKQERQAFYTPETLARRVVAEANIGAEMRVLEPSAGDGALIRALHAEGPALVLYAVESDPKACEALRRELGKYGGALIAGDFLDVAPPDAESDRFDRVVMNPPFTGHQDIEHVLHALQFLREGGRLVAIMSGGVEFSSHKIATEFRSLVENKGGTIERLPDGAFKDSGTNVRTVLVVIDN